MPLCGFCIPSRRFWLSRYTIFVVICALAASSLFIVIVSVTKLPSRRLFDGRRRLGRTKPPELRCPLPPAPPPPSRLPAQFPGLSCPVRYHVGFLKTHRCGSSAVQNVLFRLAAHHGLVPMLPPTDSQLIGAGSFRVADTCDMPGRELGFHLINVAARWNHSQIRRVLPNDTVFFSIVREPVSQFLSMFRHLELDRFISLEEFAAQSPIPATRLGGVFGQNQQLWDFGLPEEQLTDEQSIERKVAEIDRQFALVMVAERMDESLVLLRHLLCWPTGYVVTMKLNSLMSPIKLAEDDPVRRRLADWLAGDHLLYRHMYSRFEERIRSFGEDRMRQEVKALREETLRVVNECKIVRSPSDQLPEENRWSGDRVYGLSARNKSQDCQMYVIGESAWMELMRDMIEELVLLH